MDVRQLYCVTIVTMKNWKFWLGMLISIVFLWLALKDLKWSEFWEALSHANYFWLLPGIAVYFVAVWVRAWRWHYLLKPLKSIPTATMFPITTIGYMGNNIYPARAGEVLRAVLLKRRENVPISASLATIIVERVFDGVVMLSFIFLNLRELAVLDVDLGYLGNAQALAVWGTLAFVGALIVFLVAAMFPRITISISEWFIARLIPRRFQPQLKGLVHKFMDGIAALRSPANVLMVFFTSVIIWLLETVKYWFVMHAFTFQVTFFELMLLNGIANIATTIPSGPGFFGTWELVTKAVLVALHVEPNEAVGYALVLHIALWLPITALGGYWWAKEGLKWSDSLRTEVSEQA